MFFLSLATYDTEASRWFLLWDDFIGDWMVDAYAVVHKTCIQAMDDAYT